METFLESLELMSRDSLTESRVEESQRKGSNQASHLRGKSEAYREVARLLRERFLLGPGKVGDDTKCHN